MIIMGKQPGEVTEQELEALHSCEAAPCGAGRRRRPARAADVRPRGRAAGLHAVEGRRQRRIELPVARVRVRVRARLRSGRGRRRGRDAAPRPPPRRSGTSPPRPPRGAPAPNAAPSVVSTVAISAPRTSARICRQTGLASPAARRADLGGRRHPGRDHQVQPVAQAEGDALEDRPGQVPPVVRDASGRRTRRGRAGPGAGSARRTGRGGRAGRRSRPATPAAAAARSPNATPGASASRNQRRLPAAESITDIRCQRPGTAWQNAWTRPRGFVDRARPWRRRSRPTCPSESATVPVATGPDARRRWPPGRRRRRRPACRRGGRSPRPRRRHHAGHLRPLERRRHPGRVDAQSRQDLGRPVRARPGRTGACPRRRPCRSRSSPVSRRRT